MRGENQTHHPPVQLSLVAEARGTSRDAVAAKAHVVDCLDWLVGRHVKAVRMPPAEREDAAQDGIVALLLAIEKFDASRGVQFEVIAHRRVRDAVLDRVRSTGGSVVATHPLEWEVEDPGALDELDAVERQPAIEAVRAFLDTLSEAQRDIVRAVYWDGQAQAEVARARGITRAAINKTLRHVYEVGRVALAEYRPSSHHEGAA